ncbi:hypothetical protein KDA_26120 [Dictyobacter alpinus]|uniref:Uncharacterized protein n=1 Tax=Dictyobacter alpinus TaxID=2014873 RepID=A0A402B6Z3_9CHLR|nr:hypothetical protein [Dictyobacter alpinus]GCE27128.1 hypothetical protein KDA_26120 [Dictyobacter alpinus]
MLIDTLMVLWNRICGYKLTKTFVTCIFVGLGILCILGVVGLPAFSRSANISQHLPLVPNVDGGSDAIVVEPHPKSKVTPPVLASPTPTSVPTPVMTMVPPSQDQIPVPIILSPTSVIPPHPTPRVAIKLRPRWGYPRRPLHIMSAPTRVVVKAPEPIITPSVAPVPTPKVVTPTTNPTPVPEPAPTGTALPDIKPSPTSTSTVPATPDPALTISDTLLP